MSEIPEHLLKRSRSAKASKSGGDAGADDAAPVAASPSAPAAATPTGAAPIPANLPNLDPEPEPVTPDPPYVKAAKARKKVPVWALPVIAALPIWAISYSGTMQQPEVDDPVLIESAIYYSELGCAGCHGAGGGGGTGYAFVDGEVLETFPEAIDQMAHVARGSQAIIDEEYGAVRDNGERRVAGGRGQGQMPAQLGQISQIQLELVTFHERATLGGEDTSGPGYEEWMEHMRETYEAGNSPTLDQEYLDFLLACANPEYTPGATGEGSPDPETRPCPGPHAEEAEEAALGG